MVEDDAQIVPQPTNKRDIECKSWLCASLGFKLAQTLTASGEAALRHGSNFPPNVHLSLDIRHKALIALP